MDLGNAEKYSDLMNFILEHVDPSSRLEGDDNLLAMVNNKKFLISSTSNVGALGLAAFFGITDVVVNMIKILDNSIPSRRETSKWNLIRLAAVNGKLDTIKALMNISGVMPLDDNPPKESNKSASPIHFAALNGHLETVKFLVDFTNEPNAQDTFGSTPIHTAVRVGNLEVVKFLVDFTDTPNAPNNQGHTPIDLAKRYQHYKITKFLEKHCNIGTPSMKCCCIS